MTSWQQITPINNWKSLWNGRLAPGFVRPYLYSVCRSLWESWWIWNNNINICRLWVFGPSVRANEFMVAAFFLILKMILACHVFCVSLFLPPKKKVIIYVVYRFILDTCPDAIGHNTIIISQYNKIYFIDTTKGKYIHSENIRENALRAKSFLFQTTFVW